MALLNLLRTMRGKKVCLQGLVILRLDNNRLNGSLPTSWGSFFGIRSVDLASIGNTFTGGVPATWSNWSQVGNSFPVPVLHLL